MESHLQWVPHPDLAFTPAALLPIGPSKYKARLPDGTDFILDVDQNTPPLLPVHETSLQSQENLLNLSELTEQAMLHQLRLRFAQNQIYTFISTILVSVNPFKSIPNLYTPDQISDAIKRAREYSTNPPPHVYQIGAQAYFSLVMSTTPVSHHSVVISGESGSGKSVHCSLILDFLSAVSDKVGTHIDHNTQTHNELSKSQSISEKIIASSSSVLEAFGNAKTSRNLNSSRFGKYIRLFFTHASHLLAGASIDSYLLEKSRITSVIPGERNYHIFYQLLSGLNDDMKKKLHINGSTEQFSILRGSELHSTTNQDHMNITGFDDKSDFIKTRDGLAGYFNEQQLDHIWRVLAGLLHFGNIKFEENKGATNDGVKLTDDSLPIIDIVVELLGLDKDILIQSLLYQKLQVGKELVRKTKNMSDATSGRDAAIRAVYDTQFSWIIAETNRGLAPSQPNYQNTMSTISVLDIFGFEDFPINSFEQLLINFTNEKMQSFFNSYAFEMELTEYRQEKLDIDINSITYTNNIPCLDLIETGPTSILSMIDDELKLPKANDATFLAKLDQKHEFHPYYTKTRTKAPIFTISHYAANVTYTVENWLVKSKDDLQLDLAHCFTLSTIPHLRDTMTEFHSQRKGPQRSLGFKFKGQLTELVTMLFNSSPYFIRCIKSNHQLAGGVFDSAMVLGQMKYLGLMSLVKIRQVGYPLRLEYQQFLQRYNLLQLSNDENNPPRSVQELMKLPLDAQQATCKAILLRTDPTGKHWKLGLTKVFYRNNVQANLEHMRADELEQQTVYLQAYIKTIMAQRSFNAMMKVINDIEGFINLYHTKLSSRSLSEILPTILLPQITTLIPQAQKHNLDYDPTSQKRGMVAATKLYQLQQRLNEQEDSLSFLERSILVSNKEMLLAAMEEVQLAYLTPYNQEREGTVIEKVPNQIDLDQFATSVATLLQSAVQLYHELDEFDKLRVQTETQRTLDLALKLIKTAQQLGVDKSVVTECEQLYKTIADEERKRKEEEEAREKERKRQEEEKKRKEAEELAKLEAEKARLQREKDEKEAADAAAVAAAAAAAAAAPIATSTKKQDTTAKTSKDATDKFFNEADQSSVLIASTESTTAKRPTSSGSGDKRMKPDYNKINSLIERSQHAQLRQYLSHFELIEDVVSQLDHILLTPNGSVSYHQQRRYYLSLNTPHVTKPFDTTLPIFEAIVRGDITTLETLIDYGKVNVNAPHPIKGFTPLSFAIQQGKYNIAMLLLEKYDACVSRFDVLADETEPEQANASKPTAPPTTPTSASHHSHNNNGNCIGHIVAQSLASLLSKFSTTKAQNYIPLLRLILDKNDTVIYNVPNNAHHTAIQYFKKILKSGLTQLTAQKSSLEQQIKSDGNAPNTPANSLTQHGVKDKTAVKNLERDLVKCSESLQFLDSIKSLLFETSDSPPVATTTTTPTTTTTTTTTPTKVK